MSTRCLHFGVCGGCKTQHLTYEEELQQKQETLSSLFPSQTVASLLPCFSPWEYRNKMEFSFSQAKSGERFCGLMAKRGRVVNLEECLLVAPWFTAVLEGVRNWWKESGLPAYFPPKDLGLLRTLTLREGRRTGERMAFLTIAGNQIEERHLETFVKQLLSICPFTSILVRGQITAKKMPTRFEERVLHGKNHIHEILYDEEGTPFRFKIRASSFFQPNPLQAERLIQKGLSLVELEGKRVFDLYCGTATLGIFASKRAKEVIGVELNPDAIEDGLENIKINHINNVTLIQGDVGLVCPTTHVDVVIIDPPRTGLEPKALAHLILLKPDQILYISCNPLTQARDLIPLQEAGYRIAAIQPVDQFPKTPHMENIVVLKKG